MSKVSYSLLSLNFSKVKGLSVKQVGTLIGGKVGANISGEIFRNGCAIRLSYAFNYSGLPIRRGFGSVSTGGDGKLYLYRVNDMLTFLKANISRKPLVGKTSSDFKGKQGIIVFWSVLGRMLPGTLIYIMGLLLKVRITVLTVRRFIFTN